LNIEGRFYHRGEIIEGALQIEDGKIKSIKKTLPNSKKIKGIIFPGALDIHVHFRDPGFTHKEDFYTGTLSAAHGGVTFVMDMPNTYPPVGDLSTFQDKLRIVRQRANVDFSLYFLLNDRAEYLKEHNAAFKLYMGETTSAVSGEIRSVDAFISVHAELDECIRKESKDLRDHDMARPESCEVQAVKKLLDKGKFHIAHVSSIDTVDMCKVGRFTCEVTPHHLFLHRDMPLGAFGKVNPPLRAKWMAERLWDELIKGRIDIVASDHAPHTMEEKEEEFPYAPAGIPEVETYVPIFLYLMKIGRIPMKRMVEVLMEKPGEIVGLKKGKIEVGYDADLAAYNLSDVRRISDRDIHYKCGWTPYRGFNAIFPHTVLLRGEEVIEDHELVGERLGNFVRVGGKF
jgi:dihydroorotase